MSDVYCVMMRDLSGYGMDGLVAVCATEELANEYIKSMLVGHSDCYVHYERVLTEAPRATE